jgi:hypothetical protein
LSPLLIFDTFDFIFSTSIGISMISNKQVETVYNLLLGTISYPDLFSKGFWSKLMSNKAPLGNDNKTLAKKYKAVFDKQGKIIDKHRAQGLILYYLEFADEKRDSSVYNYRAMLICAMAINQGYLENIATLKVILEGKHFDDTCDLSKLHNQVNYLSKQHSSNASATQENVSEALSKIDNYHRILALEPTFNNASILNQKVNIAIEILAGNNELLTQTKPDEEINRLYKVQARLTHPDKSIPDRQGFLICKKAKDFLSEYLEFIKIDELLKTPYKAPSLHLQLELIIEEIDNLRSQQMPYTLNLNQKIDYATQRDQKLSEIEFDIQKISNAIDSYEKFGNTNQCTYNSVQVGELRRSIKNINISSMRNTWQEKIAEFSQEKSELNAKLDDYSEYLSAKLKKQSFLLEKASGISTKMHSICQSEKAPNEKSIELTDIYNMAILQAYFANIEQLIKDYEASRKSINQERAHSIKNLRDAMLTAKSELAKDSNSSQKVLNTLSTTLDDEYEYTRRSHNWCFFKWWKSGLQKKLIAAQELTPELEQFKEHQDYIVY